MATLRDSASVVQNSSRSTTTRVREKKTEKIRPTLTENYIKNKNRKSIRIFFFFLAPKRIAHYEWQVIVVCSVL